MAKLSQAINPDEIEERNSTLPPDTYKIMCSHSEIKPTSSNDGKMLVLEFDVQDGPQAGRKIYERLNIENKNPKTVDIAFKVLAEIGRACGIANLSDSDQLHGKMLLAEVVVDPAKPYKDKTTGQEKMGYDQNRVKKYLPYASTSAKPAAAAKTPANTAQQTDDDTGTEQPATETAKEEPAKGATPPWKQNKGKGGKAAAK